jgi:hypothetical protein
MVGDDNGVPKACHDHNRCKSTTPTTKTIEQSDEIIEVIHHHYLKGWRRFSSTFIITKVESISQYNGEIPKKTTS